MQARKTLAHKKKSSWRCCGFRLRWSVAKVLSSKYWGVQVIHVLIRWPWYVRWGFPTSFPKKFWKKPANKPQHFKKTISLDAKISLHS